MSDLVKAFYGGFTSKGCHVDPDFHRQKHMIETTSIRLPSDLSLSAQAGFRRDDQKMAFPAFPIDTIDISMIFFLLFKLLIFI